MEIAPPKRLAFVPAKAAREALNAAPGAAKARPRAVSVNVVAACGS
jgi:hypothetical protein